MTAPVPAPDTWLHTMYYIFEVVAGFVGFAALVTFGLLVRKYSVFKFQNEAIDNLTTAYTSLEKRFGEETTCRKELEVRVQEQAETIADLKGVIRGRGHTIEEMYQAAIDSGGCELAFNGCQLRVVPGARVFTSGQTVSDKVGGTDA